MPARVGNASDDRRHAERIELTRRCAVRIIDNHNAGRAVDPHSLQWARDFTALNPPLEGALGTGEPQGGGSRDEPVTRAPEQRP